MTKKPNPICTARLRSYKDAKQARKARKRPFVTVREALKNAESQTTDVSFYVISLPVFLDWKTKIERIVKNAEFLASIEHSDVDLFAVWVPEGARQNRVKR